MKCIKFTISKQTMLDALEDTDALDLFVSAPDDMIIAAAENSVLELQSEWRSANHLNADIFVRLPGRDR